MGVDFREMRFVYAPPMSMLVEQALSEFQAPSTFALAFGERGIEGGTAGAAATGCGCGAPPSPDPTLAFFNLTACSRERPRGASCGLRR